MKVIANQRTAQGTGASRRLRLQDKVPGILYGAGKEPVSIELAHNPLFHALRREKFHSSILEMELDGQLERVLLRDFQMHAYKPSVLHIDFQRIAEDQPIHMRVPLHFVGVEHSPAVKISAAIVSHVASEIDIACLPRHLPEFIEVDLSSLTVQQTIHASDIQFPEGVSLVRRGKENPVLVTVSVPAGAKEETPAAAVAAAPATPAAAAKGAAKAPPAKKK